MPVCFIHEYISGQQNILEDSDIRLCKRNTYMDEKEGACEMKKEEEKGVCGMMGGP